MILAIANQKGGVGKTTTAVSVGHWFSMRQYRTLLVDLDGQGHLAASLGLAKGNGLYRLLGEGRRLGECVTQARPGLDVVTNDHTGELAKEIVRQANFREFMLAEALEDGEGHDPYEVVVLDTPPSTDLLHVLALVAADYLVVPAVMDYLALDGVGYVLRTLRSLGKYAGVTPPALVGVLPTMFEKLTSETMANVAELQKLVGTEQVLAPIPKDTKVREASAHGMTIWEYAPKSAAAVGFEQAGARLTNSANKVGGYLHLGEVLRELV